MAALPPPQGANAQQFLNDLNLDYRRIHKNALMGGFGALVGWLITSLLDALLVMLGKPGVSDLSGYMQALIQGPIWGACIGAAIGSTEGLFGSRNIKQALRGALFGAGLGFGGGLVGLLIGEFIFGLRIPLIPGIVKRAIGWGVFGALVGISDGVAAKMPAKIRYGVLGGLLGGLVGGSTYQGLTAIIRGLGFSSGGLAWGSAIGVVIVGACIGFMMSLVENLLRKAWLFFITGRLEGQTRTLDSSRPHTIGTAAGCTIVIPSDPTVQPIHAEITFVGNDEFSVQPRDGQVIVRRDGRDQQVTSHVLAPGDRILLGETRMIFRNVEGKKR